MGYHAVVAVGEPKFWSAGARPFGWGSVADPLKINPFLRVLLQHIWHISLELLVSSFCKMHMYMHTFRFYI